MAATTRSFFCSFPPPSNFLVSGRFFSYHPRTGRRLFWFWFL